MKRNLILIVSLLGAGLILCQFLLFIRGWASSRETAPKKQIASDRVTASASGRGYPWINLSDGRNVPTVYSGEDGIKQAFEQDQARPLSLAAGDFDEDGVPDLVSGYASPGDGLLTLHRGNVASIYPNSREAQQQKANGEASDSPFLPSARVFALPAPPDFIGAGDFDADRHCDVVAAAAGGQSLYLMTGDGRGGFGAARRIDLPGGVTALATGEFNRADGLTDIVVGIAAPVGPRLLVFAGPEGALLAEAEEFALPAPAVALALGQLDDDSWPDLAVAAGHHLVIMRGRNRKLSPDAIGQAEASQPMISQRSLPFAAQLMAIGDFTADQRMELALLSDDGAMRLLSQSGSKAKGVGDWSIDEIPTGGHWPEATGLVRAKVSSRPKDDLVVLDQAGDQLHVISQWSEENPAATADGQQATDNQVVSLDLEGGPVAALPMRLNEDALGDLAILRKGQSAPMVIVTASAVTFTVNSIGDGDDNNPGDGVCNDGAGACTLRAAIREANASVVLDTIKINIPCADNSACSVTIRPKSQLPQITQPVVIDGTEQRIGSQLIGRAGLNGGLSGGIGLDIKAGNSAVRGLVINGWNDGIWLTEGGGNIIEGNYLGTDFSAVSCLPNTFGMKIGIGSNNNIIGGTTPAARNVISGNNNSGIAAPLPSGSTTGNIIQGNFIGTNAAGTAAIPNSQTVLDSAGIYLKSGSNANNILTNTTIGGTVAGARNVISGNKRHGIWIEASQSLPGLTNLVQGNYIGTSAAGTVVLPNQAQGVYLLDTPNNTISDNVISGNTGDGILIVDNNGGSQGGGATGNVVKSNLIGTDKDGAAALPNFGGVRLGTLANSNEIANNVISGNRESGVVIVGNNNTDATMNNLVRDNLVGTNATGQAALPNNLFGVVIQSNADNNSLINNVISGNKSGGVVIQGNSPDGNALVSNRIGVNKDGTVALGNSGSGVLITAGSANIRSNVISGNNGAGVLIQGAGSNLVQGNFIGADATGAIALGNSVQGVFINNSPGNLIGGTTDFERNVISGNLIGIQIRGSEATMNQVLGNFIGANAAGVADLGNVSDGVSINDAFGNTIGGTMAGARNVISGNDGHGVSLRGNNNLVQGNFIGVDVTGTAALGNNIFGVSILNAAGNTVGGTTANSGNTIAFNRTGGVVLTAPDPIPVTGNAILSNSIFSNFAEFAHPGTGGLGIDLGEDGVTPTDANDADPGANKLQNFPVLTSATVAAGSVTIQGTLNSTANTNFRLEFFSNSACDPLGHGEGQSFIGSAMAPTDANGNASFSVSFATAVAAGQLITATATDPNNNTSEFSQCRQVANQMSSVSAASFGGTALATESIVAAFGTGLATGTRTAVTLPLPTSLAGTTLKVKDSAGNERLASLFFVAPTQVNYQMPPGTAAGSATITVASGNGTVSVGQAQIAAVAPGLFTANANGQGVAAAVALRVKADGAQSFEPVARYDSGQNRFFSAPLDLGPENEQVFLILFGSGIRFRSSLAAVTVTIGGASAPVLFADAQGGFVGLDQVNARIPRSLIGRGEVDLVLTADGKPANTVKVNIK